MAEVEKVRAPWLVIRDYLHQHSEYNYLETDAENIMRIGNVPEYVANDLVEEITEFYSFIGLLVKMFPTTNFEFWFDLQNKYREYYLSLDQVSFLTLVREGSKDREFLKGMLTKTETPIQDLFSQREYIDECCAVGAAYLTGMHPYAVTRSRHNKAIMGKIAEYNDNEASSFEDVCTYIQEQFPDLMVKHIPLEDLEYHQ